MEGITRQQLRIAATPITVSLFLLLLSPTAFGGFLPVGQPEYDFLYERMVYRMATGEDRFDYQIGPYRYATFGEFSSVDTLYPFDCWRYEGHDRLQLFGFGSENYRAADGHDPIGYESIRAGVAGEPFSKLSIYADFILDEEMADDPDYSGKKWRGLAGDVDQAFVAYRAERFDIMAGRFGGFWGGQRSLIFSPEQKLDGLAYTIRWGFLSLAYRLGQLDGLSPDEDSVTQFEPRYIAAHRLDIHFSQSTRIGLFETVVFGGPGRQLDLFYLNPIIFMHGSQLNENLNDNTMVGIDFDFQTGDGLLAYGQILVDDLQVDNKSQSDKEPDQYGLLLGTYYSRPEDRLSLRLEYEKVTNWTFNQVHARNRYLNDGAPIGSALGNDYDRSRLELFYWHNEHLRLPLRFAYTRVGEGNIGADWSAPWLDIEGDYSEPFPTGIVERITSLSLGLNGFLTDFSYLDFQAGFDWVRNEGHISGEDRTRPFVSLYLSAFLLSALQLD